MNQQPTQRASFPWTAAVISCAVVIICGFALVAYIRTGRAAKEVAETVMQGLPTIAEKFKTGNITHTFIEEIPQVMPTNGDVLELATARSVETFRKSDSKTYYKFYLGTTVSEIRVPVTFRYHLRLSEPWTLATRTNICLVLSPPIRPSQPPALHTDHIEKRTQSGWFRFNKNESLDELERSITPVLQQRASDPRHLRLVREACRQSVAEFVKQWLLRDDHWRPDRFSAIVVVFPDEVPFKSAEQLELFEQEPTITLNTPRG